MIRPRAAAAPGPHLHDEHGDDQIIDQLARHPLLSADEERRLSTLARGGDQAARDEMVRCNQKLVISIARMFRGRGVAFLDLIQEGNIGLLRAVDKFEPKRGLKFSTFAVWWVRQAIGRAVQNDGRIVRLPVHAYEALTRLRKAERELTRELGEEPTTAQLAERLGLTIAVVERQLSWTITTLSLDASQTDDEDGPTLGGIFAVHLDEAAHTAVEEREVTANVSALLDDLGQLDPRARQIIELRFGLNGQGVHTLEACGAALGITRERVRQLQVDAMDTLRRYAARRPELQGVLS